MRYLLFLLLICSSAFCFAAENPYASANVGDWVKTKNITILDGKTYTVITTETVTKKTSKKVVVSIRRERDGKAKCYWSAIFLDEPYNPYGLLPGEETEILGRGEETLIVNGEELRCNWVEFKNRWLKCKFWYNQKVPHQGIVKSVMEGSAVTTSELICYGYGKK